MIIKCKSNTLNKNRFNVFLYDYNYKLLFKDSTDDNGYYYIKNINKDLILVLNAPKNLYPSVILKKISTNKDLEFNFYVQKNNNSTHKFFVHDFNYEGLPIDKGEIKLWLNHTV